jgi:hypothetical protein
LCSESEIDAAVQKIETETETAYWTTKGKLAEWQAAKASLDPKAALDELITVGDQNRIKEAIAAAKLKDPILKRQIEAVQRAEEAGSGAGGSAKPKMSLQDKQNYHKKEMIKAVGLLANARKIHADEGTRTVVS